MHDLAREYAVRADPQFGFAARVRDGRGEIVAGLDIGPAQRMLLDRTIAEPSAERAHALALAFA